MKFYELSEEEQNSVVRRIREELQFEDWYEACVDMNKPLKEIVCDAMASAVADTLMSMRLWVWEDGKATVDVEVMNDLTTKKFDIPTVDPERGDDFLESADLEWIFDKEAESE